MNGRGNWGSKIGFILAASGSAVGLGNIWRFPYTASRAGGALFVIVYILCVIFIALPVLLAAISLGRFTEKNPVGAFASIKSGGYWKCVGYLGVLTGTMILSFYAVIAGWTVGYFYKSIAGHFKNVNKDNISQMFKNFSSNHLFQILLLAFFLFLTVYVVSRGVSGGIEKFSKILMPVLFCIMILLLFRSLTLKDASVGIEKYLKPDFSTFTPKIILMAMGQAFFSLSLGMGTMITYGSYVTKKENLPSSSGWIAFFDTFIAVMAGLIIFPAVYALGMEATKAGPGLVFEILPAIFSQMTGGFLFGSLFFLLLAIAALTSTISVLEVPVAYLVDERKWNRKKSAVTVGIITLIFGVPSAISGEFLDLMNFIWGNLSLSIGAFFIAIFVGYIWKTSNALKEISKGNERFRLAKVWVILIRFITPIFIFCILMGILLLGLRF